MLKISRWSLVVSFWIVAVILQEIFSGLFLITPNYGLSFGWWGGSGILIINIFVLLLMIWWYWRKKTWGLFLILVGGLVNLVDRLRFGYVRDYWGVPLTEIKNNLADWLIFIGMIVIICNLESWWKKKNM